MSLNSEFVVEEIDGELVILAPNQGQVHTMNESASILWRTLEQNSSLQNASACLTSTYALTPQEAETAVTDFLNQIQELGIRHLLPRVE